MFKLIRTIISALFASILLLSTTTGSFAIDKLHFVIGLVIGADSFQFEILQDSLPREIIILDKDKNKKILKANFLKDILSFKSGFFIFLTLEYLQWSKTVSINSFSEISLSLISSGIEIFFFLKGTLKKDFFLSTSVIIILKKLCLLL